MSVPQVMPIVKMQKDGSGASIVSYNVPEPTTYFGNKYFEIDLEDLVQSDPQFAGVDWPTFFKDFANLPFTGRDSAIALLQTLRQRVLLVITRKIKQKYLNKSISVVQIIC
jgi:hypothetical protein